MKCQIPYGPSALDFELPDEMVAGVLESSVEPSSGFEDDIVLDAMANPYGGVKLKDLAKGKATCTIIISDHTRPVPSKHIIPFMLAELREGNPIHNDMVDAARQAKLAYIVNVVIDDDKRVIAAFAGDPFEAHSAGAEYLASQCRVNAVPADIVITGNGGSPLDQNMYHAVKSMTAAEACANEGGVIIECAECADGTGGEGFYRALKDCASALSLMDEILQVPQDETKPGQWEYQIQARILMHHPVIYVSCPEMRQIIEEMKCYTQRRSKRHSVWPVRSLEKRRRLCSYRTAYRSSYRRETADGCFPG